MRLDRFEDNILLKIFGMLSVLSLMRLELVCRRFLALTHAEVKSESSSSGPVLRDLQDKLKRQLIPMNVFFLNQLSRYCLNSKELESKRPVVLYSRMRPLGVLGGMSWRSACASVPLMSEWNSPGFSRQLTRAFGNFQNDSEGFQALLRVPEIMVSETDAIKYFQKSLLPEHYQIGLKLAALLGYENSVIYLLNFSRAERSKMHMDDCKLAVKMSTCNGHLNLAKKIRQEYVDTAPVVFNFDGAHLFNFQDTLFAIRCDSLGALQSEVLPWSAQNSSRDEPDFPAMIQEAVKFGSVRVLDFLLRLSPENLSIRNTRLGWQNLIELAALYNQVHVMDMLHKDFSFPLNANVMTQALISNMPEGVIYLLKNGLELPEDALLLAADLEDMRLTEYLLREKKLACDPTVRTEYGDTVLHRVIKRFSQLVDKPFTALPCTTLVTELFVIYGNDYFSGKDQRRWITAGERPNRDYEEVMDIAFSNLFRYLELCKGQYDLNTKNSSEESSCDLIRLHLNEGYLAKFDLLMGKNLEIIFCLMDFARGTLNITEATQKIDELIAAIPENRLVYFAKVLITGKECDQEFDDKELDRHILNFKANMQILLKGISENDVARNLSLLDNFGRKRICLIC